MDVHIRHACAKTLETDGHDKMIQTSPGEQVAASLSVTDNNVKPQEDRAYLSVFRGKIVLELLVSACRHSFCHFFRLYRLVSCQCLFTANRLAQL